MLPASPAVVVLPLTGIAGLLAWWGWERGAYFGVVFFPGAMALLALLMTLLLFAPWPARLQGPAAISLGALAALAAWTMLSALWSPAPDIALEDAMRVLSYAVAFALGLWLCLLLGRRMALALAPLAAAGGIVAVATLLALWIGDDATELLEIDATLRYPLGYRNAVACFFISAVWPLIVLAAERDLDWRLRGLLLGGATLALELAVLAQSRASLLAAGVAAVVLIGLHPRRLPILGVLALAALPVGLALPFLLDVYQQDGGQTAESLPPLRTACAAMALTTGLSVVVGLAAARGGDRISLSASAERAIGGAITAALAIVLVIGAVTLVRGEGGPAGFLDRQAEDLTAESPDLEGSRFGLDLRTERGDFWRVALDDLAANPLLGEGAGGWRFSYLLDRETDIQPEDPHSVGMLMASELGFPGVLLFGAFGISAVLAALRARKLGPSAAALTAGALASAAYWFVQASVDWFWSYPALTLPIIFLLGAAAAPTLLRPTGEARPTQRRGLAAAAVLAAALMLPLLFSERYTKDALGNWRTDLTGAYSDLGRAADLNPLSARPLVAEAVIAESAGEPQRALSALAAAQERQPGEWTLYYLEARVLGPIDEAGAARAIARARELNPRGEEIDELEGGTTSEP